MVKKNIKLTLCYDGSSFYGWQKADSLPSIEKELEKALFTILQVPVNLQAASRTDAGVHATGQIASFFLDHLKMPLEKLQASLNKLLPSAIQVLDIEEMPSSFHPTLDNTGKKYLYQITTSAFLHPFKRHTHWHYPKSLDLALMQKAASYLIGEKDFTSLTNFRKPPHKDTVCYLKQVEVRQENEDFLITVIGDHFLYKMVRNIAGLLCYAGCKKISPEEIPHLLESKTRENITMTAPSHGLFLEKVFFPSFKKENQLGF